MSLPALVKDSTITLNCSAVPPAANTGMTLYPLDSNDSIIAYVGCSCWDETYIVLSNIPTVRVLEESK